VRGAGPRGGFGTRIWTKQASCILLCIGTQKQRKADGIAHSPSSPGIGRRFQPPETKLLRFPRDRSDKGEARLQFGHADYGFALVPGGGDRIAFERKKILVSKRFFLIDQERAFEPLPFVIAFIPPDSYFAGQNGNADLHGARRKMV